MRSKRARLAIVLALGLVPGLSPLQQATPAAAAHTMPALDPSQIDYTPVGYWGPPDDRELPQGVTGSATIPETPPNGEPLAVGPNPSGKWVSYDTNVFEALSFPGRHPGDNCNSLAEDERHPSCRAGDMDPDNDQGTGYAGPGGYSPVHGECPPSPGFPSGECFNNQLEWLDHYESSMEQMLADMGVVVHRYPFHSPGRSDGGTERGAPGGTDSAGGQAYNISATIPGADHPEETVLVSGHYDFTDGGPAAAWDSAEGHTEVMRMAYIMADYYRKTGTRPSATIKFIPWDSEESGTFGSIDYVRNNIPPGEEDELRGYFNVDPCAGAYPAFKEGTAFQQQVPEVYQLANPDNWNDNAAIKEKIEAFNAQAETVINQVLEYLDDTITTPSGERPIFVSDAEAAAGNDGTQPVTASDRGKFVKAVGGLAIFSSDYANFEGIGVPIFNMFPDLFGPHADLTPASSEGIAILHTPQDNLPRLNRLTSALTTPGNAPDPTGFFASEGWAKGMEMCAQMNSWFMLQPNMGGAQTANTTDPVAYFEALPNEALINQSVTFDANGSYQYANVNNRTFVPNADLQYMWDFGDGTTASGKVVQHAYDEVGIYDARLTVLNEETGATDTMRIPVTVILSNFAGPVLDQIDPEEAKDGNFELTWSFDTDREGFKQFRVERSEDFEVVFSDNAEGDITANWEIQPAEDERVEPWQPSDSSTPKFRGNQAHSGERSYWAGVQPENMNPSPLSQSTSLQLKEPITVPNVGHVLLDFWSLYQQEGDDQGRVEVALDDGDPNTEPAWEPVEIVHVENTTLGSGDPRSCDTTNPDTLTRGFEHRAADLSAYQGRDILIRFNYFLGSENRLPSHPCGWYVDDIRLAGGNFSKIGDTTEESFDVTGLANGSYAFRVVGVFNDGVKTEASNIEVARVTEGGNQGGAKCPGYRDENGRHIVGTGRRDTLRGGPGRQVICGLGAGDTIRGARGNDLLIGGRGGDTIFGARGRDELLGNRGRDKLFGGRGRDRCRGGPQRDTERSCEI